MNREEAIQYLIDTGISPEHVMELVEAIEQEPCEELDFVQPHKKISVNLEVCKMREATQEEREGLEQYIDSIAKPCEDAISRQAALDAFGLSEKNRKYGGDHSGYNTMMLYEIQDILEDLPSVTPAQKIGRWIDVNGDGSLFKCDKCNETVCCSGNKYCPDCGAKMVEPQESEDKEFKQESINIKVMKIDDKCQECKKDWTKCGRCPVTIKWIKEHKVRDKE